MRVLHVVTLVTPTGSYGGPVRVAVNQAEALTAAGHEVVIAGAHAGYDGAPPPQLGAVQARLFPARRLVPRTGFAGLTSPGLLRWLAREAATFDVVHVHLARDLVTLPALLTASKHGPTFAQPHGMIDASDHPLARLLDAPLTRRALRRADRVFHLTAREHDDLVRIGVDPSRLVELPNGVPPAPTPEVARVHPGREVLFLARLHPRKNALSFVRAAVELAPNHPDWRFTLVGPDEGDGAAVSRAIAASGPDVRITYEGPVDPDVSLSRMAAADVLALPSHDEPFPMSVLEALSVGLPAVVTDTCGIAATLRDEGSGLVTDGSDEGLVEALDELLGSPDTLSRMSARARATASGTYSMDRVVEIVLAAYRAATAPPPTRPRVTWATNFAAPYRRPLWSGLAEQVDLTVALVQDEHSADGRVRGSEWFDDASDEYEVVRLATFGQRWSEHLVTARHSPAIIRPGDAALVLGGWEAPVYWQLARRARGIGVRTVGFYESTLASQGHTGGPVARMRNAYFRRLDAVVVPGPSSAEAVAAMGVDPERIHVGFNAVDVEHFHAAAHEAREAAPSTSEGHRFLYVGQLIPRKNVRALVEAFDAVRREGDSLSIAGAGPDADALRSLVTTLGISDNVHFHSHVAYSDMAALMATHYTLVLPSTEEVWGLVVNEALAAGLSCVVSESCGVAASVASMEHVTVCRSDVAGIADALVVRRDAWTTWDPTPEILEHTPARFASVFLATLRGGPDH